jgi:hypothetical protein
VERSGGAGRGRGDLETAAINVVLARFVIVDDLGSNTPVRHTNTIQAREPYFQRVFSVLLACCQRVGRPYTLHPPRPHLE